MSMKQAQRKGTSPFCSSVYGSQGRSLGGLARVALSLLWPVIECGAGAFNFQAGYQELNRAEEKQLSSQKGQVSYPH